MKEDRTIDTTAEELLEEERKTAEAARRTAPDDEETTALAPFTDGLPYDRDRVISEIRFYMNRTVEGIIEAGKRFVVLKEKEHKEGNFYKCLDELGVSYPTAWRFMTVARKCAGLSRVKGLQIVDLKQGIGKLYALLDVPEEELKEFEETGELRGLTMDEIDALPVKEVRARLRKRNKQIEQGKLQLTAAEDKIKDLERALAEAKEPPVYSSDEQKYVDAVAAIGMDFEKILLRIRTDLPYAKTEIPQVALKKFYYLLLYMQRETLEERLAVSERYEGAVEPIPYEPAEMELPSLDEMYQELPHLQGVVKFMSKKARQAAEGTPDAAEGSQEG